MITREHVIKIFHQYIEMHQTHTRRERGNEFIFEFFLPPSTVQVNLGRSPMRNGPTTVETRCWLNSAVTVNDLGGSAKQKKKKKKKKND
jgi:hypothetical protein